jgi:serine/threonine protein kinase
VNCRACGRRADPRKVCPSCGARPLLDGQGGLARGRVLGNKYQIDSVLGQGGMATVVAATDLTLDRQVALKVLAAELASDSDFVARFSREAKVMARLEHPNIIPVYALESLEGLHFIVMKLLSGTSLHRFTEEPQPLPWVTAVLNQLCSALDYLHQRGFVHRDLKPANVFLDAAGDVTLLDLGVVRGSGSSLTRPGTTFGTVGYMAPEQATDPESLDHRADLYSLGIVAFELLTGQFPFAVEDRADWEVLREQLTTAAPDLCALRPEVPGPAGEAVRALLAPSREDRPESAGAFFKVFVRGVAGFSPRPAPERTSVGDTTSSDSGADTQGDRAAADETTLRPVATRDELATLPARTAVERLSPRPTAPASVLTTVTLTSLGVGLLVVIWWLIMRFG